MTTWTSKGFIASVALLLLSACEVGQGTTLLDNVARSGTAKPLSQTKLAGGDITLVAPRGFCIDSKSVQRQFAIMARCDALGVPQAAEDAPLAFIIVSIQPASPDATLPTVQHVATASRLRNVTDPQIQQGQVTFRASGATPVEGVSATHWRGTTLVGGHIVAVALYGPAEGRALSGEGRSIVSAVMSNTRGGA